MDFLELEYAFVDVAMVTGEVPLVMPASHMFVILGPCNFQKLILDGNSPIFLRLGENMVQMSYTKFLLQSVDIDGNRLYMSPRGFGAVVRPVPLRDCTLGVNVDIGTEGVEVTASHENGAVRFVRVYDLDFRLTTAALNRQIKDYLVSADQASPNSILRLHRDFGSPRMPPGAFVFRPRPPVAIRRPAAAVVRRRPAAAIA